MSMHVCRNLNFPHWQHCLLPSSIVEFGTWTWNLEGNYHIPHLCKNNIFSADLVLICYGVQCTCTYSQWRPQLERCLEVLEPVCVTVRAMALHSVYISLQKTTEGSNFYFLSQTQAFTSNVHSIDIICTLQVVDYLSLVPAYWSKYRDAKYKNRTKMRKSRNVMNMR